MSRPTDTYQKVSVKLINIFETLFFDPWFWANNFQKLKCHFGNIFWSFFFEKMRIFFRGVAISSNRDWQKACVIDFWANDVTWNCHKGFQDIDIVLKRFLENFDFFYLYIIKGWNFVGWLNRPCRKIWWKNVWSLAPTSGQTVRKTSALVLVIQNKKMNIFLYQSLT